MRIYVDELPKDCVNCDFGYANNFCEIDYELDLRKFDKNQKHPKCPLQSLTDHTKKVRKEVCDEIREKAELFGVCKTGILKEEYRIDKDVLNQIEQGEPDAKD